MVASQTNLLPGVDPEDKEEKEEKGEVEMLDLHMRRAWTADMLKLGVKLPRGTR